MLSSKDQLTELVRHLESKQHIFATDPLLVTEKLKNEAGAPKDKLALRARRIDSNGHLANVLAKIQARIKAVTFILSIIWCVTGFLGLFTLLQSNVVNFFYVLVCLLGFHSLMLIAWIAMSLLNRSGRSWLALISPSYLINSRDDVSQAAVLVYEDQLNHSGMRWYLGKISHQLWLATLTGMLFAIIFLLIVRQYSFSWESTLLSDGALIQLTHALGYLPSLVGFDIPSDAAIIESRMIKGVMPIAMAQQWASLLIGSLIVYGIVPRALAFLFCALMFNRRAMTLNLSLPYYQNILQFWQSKIVDHDDFSDVAAPVAPKAVVSSGKKVAVLLEYPTATPEWWSEALTSERIDNFGVVDDREDLARLIEYLQSAPAQVVVGINAQALPDRGLLRKLDRIAAASPNGVIVQLLNLSAAPNPRFDQWQQALSERQIGLANAL